MTRENLSDKPARKAQTKRLIHAMVGHRIRLLREQLEESERDFAKFLGLSVKKYGEIEKGSVDVSVEYIYRLSIAFDVDANFFFSELNQMDAARPEDVPDRYDATELTRLVKAHSKMADKKVKKSLIELVESLANSRSN